MEKAEILQMVLPLLQMSSDDLQSSRILYESSKFRNSFYLFQQSVEKANKAFGIYTGIIGANQLKDIGHKPVKIYTKRLRKHHEQIKRLIPVFKARPSSLEIMSARTFEKYSENISDVLQAIEKFNNDDEVIVPLQEIDSMLDELDEIWFEKMPIPKRDDSVYAESFVEIISWVSQFEGENAQKFVTEFYDMVNDPARANELYEGIKMYVQKANSLVFVLATFNVLAVLVNQHGVRPRYIDRTFNPMTAYTMKFPTIRRQRDLMDALEVALKRFKRFINSN